MTAFITYRLDARIYLPVKLRCVCRRNIPVTAEVYTELSALLDIASEVSVLIRAYAGTDNYKLHALPTQPP